MTTLRLAAPAKLNFFLHITGRRSDGYHELESLAGFTAFGDVLEIAEAEELSLTVEGEFAGVLQEAPSPPAGEGWGGGEPRIQASSMWQGPPPHPSPQGGRENLVLRAARALQSHTAISKGAHIRLIKHIPVGAGLGGGSSDAAATLLGLRELWQAQVDDDALAALGLTLGSDVPVCLAGRMAWISGIGESVTPVAGTPRVWVVLVNPGVPLLTADVYRRFEGSFSPVSPRVESVGSAEELAALMRSRRNDLEAPAIALLPVIDECLAQLRATDCLIARMSGSGATCFALYEQEAQAGAAAQAIIKNQPGWWVQATTLMGQDYGKTQ